MPLSRGDFNFKIMLTGHTRQCGQKVGGVKEIHVAKRTELKRFVKATSGNSWASYEKADGVTTDIFKKYEFKKEEATFLPVLSRANGASVVTNTVTIYMDKLSQVSRDAVQNLSDESDCGLIVIVVTNEGDKWVLGYDSRFGSTYFVELAESNGDAGKAFEDAQGFTTTLSNKSIELPCSYTGEINPAS